MNCQKLAENLRNALAMKMRRAVRAASNGAVAETKFELGAASGIEYAITLVEEVTKEQKDRWVRFNSGVYKLLISKKYGFR